MPGNAAGGVWQQKLRKALGSVKDQTSIGLARVASTIMAPDLEVALVKASSHDMDQAPTEKHVHEILHLASASGAAASACVSFLARRLARTHSWIVAIKTLMIIHRLLLVDSGLNGNYPANPNSNMPDFAQELLFQARSWPSPPGRRNSFLDLSGFRDDSYIHGSDFSSFVRTYALFLDELLDFHSNIRSYSGSNSFHSEIDHDRDCDDESDYLRSNDATRRRRSRKSSVSHTSHDELHNLHSRTSADPAGRRRSAKSSKTHEELHSSANTLFQDWNSAASSSTSTSTSSSSSSSAAANSNSQTLFRKFPLMMMNVHCYKSHDLIHSIIPCVQSLLDRILVCRPTGAAETNRLVHIALYPIIKQSFQLYMHLNHGLPVVLDAFFESEEHAICIKAFEIHTLAAKQIDALESLFDFSKAVGIGRASEYPIVYRIPEQLLETMEDFLREHFMKPPENPFSKVDIETRSGPASSSKVKASENQKDANMKLSKDQNSAINTNKNTALKKDKEISHSSKVNASDLLPQESKAQLTNFLELSDNKTQSSNHDHGDKLAIALFADSQSTSENRHSKSFDSGPLQSPVQAQWEKTLFDSLNEIPCDPKPSSNHVMITGGINHHNGLHGQALGQQRIIPQSIASTSANLATISINPFPVLQAVCTHAGNNCPFLAPMSVPGLPYVQMPNNVLQNNQTLHQVPQVWHQCNREAYTLQGCNGLVETQNNVCNSRIQAVNPVPYANSASYYSFT